MRNKLLAGLLFASLTGALTAQTVTVEEKSLVLPTYEIGAPDNNPIFFTGRVYQGAQGHIYPYPMYDILTNEKKDKEYHAVYLDNGYVNVCVLPEIGGRILSATDKTNNYEIFYRQTGIKPSLIGMLGAWLSGGVEWNIPHHHRPSSYMPIDWTTEENPDGSKTIWVGETEIRHRMKWSVGITVYPDRSWVEARVKVINRTPFVQSMLYWANVSVHCGDDYEVIFPPSTQFGADHHKVYFTPWRMGEADRGSGEIVDLAWWKHYTGNSRSIFAWNFEDEFLAGYDHGKHAGTVHVANHHQVTGKKFFLWGNNDSARMWDKILSDNDGPYLELMVGAYSDNQPDYSWIGPGETREFTQRWYGIRDIGGVKNANDEAAVNLERKSSEEVFFGFNTTTKHTGAKVILRLGDNVLVEKTVSIDPATPFTETVKVPESASDYDLCATLLDAEGNVLVAYQPIKLDESKPLPDIIENTKPVEEYATVEELYYAGLRIEQFHNARLDPMEFYNEALRRDSLDSRVNTVVGLRYARQGVWDLAEKHLKRALVRPSHNYTEVKDSEPHYYLGLVYQMQGKYKEAVDHYWKATWTTTFQHSSFLALAQIASMQGNFNKALELIDRSLYTGSRDTKALTVKAYLLRKLGRDSEAKELVKDVISIDPLDYWALSEQSLLNYGDMSFFAEAEKSRGEGLVKLQELLEVATDYLSLGAFDEASKIVLESLSVGEPYTSSPLIHYYLGYFGYLKGENDAAHSEWKVASSLPVALVFPFRLEEIKMFETICSETESDGKAHYYLGNLLYFLEQKDKGLEQWLLAAEDDASLAQAFRNIGFGYGRIGNMEEAVKYYEQAVSLCNTDPRWMQELDVLYEKSKKPADERLTILEDNIETVMRHDDAVIRLVTLYNETGAYDKALDIMTNRHFHVWEGGGHIHALYVNAHLLKGFSLYQEKKYAEAVNEFEAADLYPDNLEVGRPSNGGHSLKGLYYLGKSYQAMGENDAAEKAFNMAADIDQRRLMPFSEDALFRALAMKEIGKSDEADTALRNMEEEVDNRLAGQVSVDIYSKFGEDGSNQQLLANLYYLKGLLLSADGNASEAESSLRKAIDLTPNLIWAQLFLMNPI